MENKDTNKPFDDSREQKTALEMVNLDDAITHFANERLIPIFGIAGAHGFDRALPGWHPKELMPKCDGVIVIGHPMFQHPLTMEKCTYIANRSWWLAQKIVDRQRLLGRKGSPI